MCVCVGNEEGGGRGERPKEWIFFPFKRGVLLA